MASSAWALFRAAGRAASNPPPTAHHRRRSVRWPGPKMTPLRKTRSPAAGLTFDAPARPGPGTAAGMASRRRRQVRPQLQFDRTDSRTTVVDQPGTVVSAATLLFGIAAVVAAISVGGLAISLTSSDSTPATTPRG